ncbi:exodeoxyribonuclease III [Spongorhabdus nitratireducens]
MKLVSFNTNGIRVRFHQLQALTDTHAPDIIGIQESKVTDDDFPVEALQEMGYEPYFYGQKTHYGVALLCRQKPVKVERGFPGDAPDSQRRMIIGEFETAQGKLTVINGYFPQGENREHETKFPAKTKFYADLQQYLETNFTPNDRVVVMGDFNISPQDNDIGIGPDNAKRWLKTGKCSFLPEEREWYQKLLGWGLHDSYRLHYPDKNDEFSWFDYRSRGFEREPKRGLRIDHILLSDALKDSCVDAGVDYKVRGMEKPSDHAPIWTEITL